MDVLDNPVIGVLGGSGGVGASTLAAVLAHQAGRDHGCGVLVDLDVAGGGVDLLLGIGDEPGARWSGVRLGGGALEPDVLLGGLPRAGACSVLAADDAELDAAAVGQVLDTARAAGPVVLDLPRRPDDARAEALARCSLVVLLARGHVPALVAARRVRESLPEVPLGLVLRRGDVRLDVAADLVGVEVLDELPPVGSARPRLNLLRPPGAMARFARGLLDGMLGCPGDEELLEAGREGWT